MACSTGCHGDGGKTECNAGGDKEREGSGIVGHWQLKGLCENTRHPFFCLCHKHRTLQASIQLHVKNVISNKSPAYRIFAEKGFRNNVKVFESENSVSPKLENWQTRMCSFKLEVTLFLN